MLLLAGCDRQGNFAPVDMWNRSRYKPYEETSYFPDRTSSRGIPINTVARGQLKTDEPYYYGTNGGAYIAGYPAQIKVNAELLQRGQERYQIYCQMCHGEGGYGNGMIVKRGFSPPPSYHIARLQEPTTANGVGSPNGHLYDVITNGYGAMYSYASRIPVQDRWAIVAYIRALQLSQKGAPQSQKNPSIVQQHSFANSANQRANDPGESLGAEQGPAEVTERSPVPAQAGQVNKPGNAENQKTG